MAEPPEELEALRTRVADALTRFRTDLSAIEAQVRGVAARTASARRVAPAAARPGLLLLPSPEQTAAPSPVPSGDTTLDILRILLRYGIEQRSYDIQDAIVAPDPITDKGNSFDAGEFWDHWIISPSIDSRISFRAQPTPNTPIITAGQTMNFQVRARTVYYVSANPGTSGSLNLWLAKYSGG